MKKRPLIPEAAVVAGRIAIALDRGADQQRPRLGLQPGQRGGAHVGQAFGHFVPRLG
jgi:hypothetical protein